MFPLQIKAAKEILEYFKTNSYVILFALMQSGKLDTFMLVCCEMLRLNLVQHAVVFTGNRELQLKNQMMDTEKFIQSYAYYLTGDEFGYSEELAECIAKGCVSRIKILGGQDLAKYKPQPKTVYVHDESHYGQSVGQQVGKFLAKINVKGSGEVSDGDYMLSVSATPFTEQVNNLEMGDKKCVRLDTTEKYISVEKLKDSGRLRNLCNMAEVEAILRSVVSSTPSGYFIIRATEKKQQTLNTIIKSLDCECIHFDQTNDSKDINDILRVQPTKLIIVYLKGMCRMGKQLYKRYIVCGMETSKNAKTDTVLQGLIGRWCGYTPYKFNAPIYILNLDWCEIDRYIDLFNGNESSIPHKAMNLKPCKKRRVPMIPCKIDVHEDDPDHEISDTILTAYEEGKIQNPNHSKYDAMFKIITICEARRAKNKTPEQKKLAKQFIFKHSAREPQKQKFKDTFDSIEQAFELKQARAYGSGYGSSLVKEDQLFVWQSNQRGPIYMYMFIDTDNHVPNTTGREIFKDTTEYFDSL